MFVIQRENSFVLVMSNSLISVLFCAFQVVDVMMSTTEVLRLLDHDYAAYVLRIPVESQQYGNEFTVIRAMRSKRDNQATSKPLYIQTSKYLSTQVNVTDQD